MPPAGGAIGSRCATHGTIHRARRAIRWCAAVPPAWPAAASATAARIRHRSTGRRTRHPRPDVAFLVSRPSLAPNMLMLGGIDSHSTRTFKHTFKTASQDDVSFMMAFKKNVILRSPHRGRLEGRVGLMQ